MRDRGWLGFTFPGLTAGGVPLPSLRILPSVPVLEKDPGYDAYYDENGENLKDDLGYVVSGWARGLHCSEDCGRRC